MSNSQLRIAYALTKYHQTTQTFIDNEISELRRRDVEVHIVAVEHGHVDRSHDANVVYLDGVELRPRETVPTHARFALRHPSRYVRFLRRVWQYRSEMGRRPEQLPWWLLPQVATRLSEAGVSLVHCHFAWSGATAAACLSPLLATPWTMTVHAKDIFVKQRNLGRKLGSADLVITVSDYNRRWLSARFATARPIEVLTCGIKAVARPPSEPTVDVVTVARLVPKKGVDVLIRAVSILRQSGQFLSVEIVGDGPLRTELEALAEATGVADGVRFLGDLPHREALQRIAQARVFCLPCRVGPDGDRDAAPTVLIEAMMRGVPVVSSTAVGIGEFIDDSCGILTAPDDAAGTALAISRIVNDPELASRLGTAGASRARERFDVEHQVAQLEQLLEHSARAGIQRTLLTLRVRR